MNTVSRILKYPKNLVNNLLSSLAPGMLQNIRKMMWEKRWSRANFSPSWDAERIFPKLEEALKSGWFRHDEKILDIGCGSGNKTAWLAEQGYRVRGIDFSESAIKLAKQTHEDYGGRLEFETRDILDHPGDSEHYSSLVDMGCFHTIEKNLASVYVRNVHSLCTEGAHFLLHHIVKDKTLVEEHTEYIKSMFENEFEILKIEKTNLGEATWKSSGKAKVGLVGWMKRK